MPGLGQLASFTCGEPDAVSQAQQALLMTAVSSPLAERYRTEQPT